MANEPHLWAWLADLTLMVHAAFILFVVGGQALILAGWGLGWVWPRAFWFRFLHLLAIGMVVLEAWFGITCPLTVLESRLRIWSGVAGYDNGFIRHWLHELIFYTAAPWIFTLIYTVFFGLVLASWMMYPPRQKL